MAHLGKVAHQTCAPRFSQHTPSSIFALTVHLDFHTERVSQPCRRRCTSYGHTWMNAVWTSRACCPSIRLRPLPLLQLALLGGGGRGVIGLLVALRQLILRWKGSQGVPLAGPHLMPSTCLIHSTSELRWMPSTSVFDGSSGLFFSASLSHAHAARPPIRLN